MRIENTAASGSTSVNESPRAVSESEQDRAAQAPIGEQRGERPGERTGHDAGDDRECDGARPAGPVPAIASTTVNAYDASDIAAQAMTNSRSSRRQPFSKTRPAAHAATLQRTRSIARARHVR